MKKIILSREPNYKAKKDAFSFQEKAFIFCKDKPYSAIFHEQGLGKTKIGIDLLLYWLEKTDIDTVLIVTKKTLVLNWKEELVFHTHLHPRFLTSNKRDNFFVFNSTSRVIITNFETIPSEKERLKLFCRARNVAIIIDESAKIKNPDSLLTSSFFELSDFFKKKVIMSGTPSANRPYDMWSQIYFLDKGNSLGDDFDSFRKSTDLPNDSSSSFDYSKILSQIFDKINDFAIRETKISANLTLPEKRFFDIWTLFTQEQWVFYNKIKDDTKIEIMKNGELIEDDSSQALKRLLRLLQATSNPRIIDDKFSSKTGKEIELNRLVKQIMARGEKTIIWTCFVKNVDYLFDKYKDKYGAVRFYGSMSSEERKEAINSFKFGNANIFIATPQSAKEGLTLTVANNAIFYDRSFSLDDYLQAQDRIHRISQERECNIYNIMIRGSIDEWIDSLLKAKGKAAALAQSDISEESFNNDINYSYSTIIKRILNSKKEIPYE